MCGIVGVIATAPVQAPRALSLIAHRGPDGEGTEQAGNVWLGHRRLAIIDLSSAGAQPMRKPGCGTIAFNGEIYDHAAHRQDLERNGAAFETHSDTEVLLRGLAGRGPSFLAGIHGMYAFAWLEPDGRRLWLARDHAGMKPLYLWRGTEGVAFASEVRALAEAVRSLGGSVRLSTSALSSFLAWGAVPEPACIFEGAEMVPADSAVAIDTRPPWESRVVPTNRLATSSGGSQVAAVERVRAALGAAVERHLVADTPVALFLSSGIDSGVLAVELARSATRPCAISVMLESRGTGDEPELVRRSAARLGLRLELVPFEDGSSQLAGALDCYDQPSVDGLNTYLVAEAARRLGYKVAISGVGADEVFGGYAHLRRSLRWLTRMPGLRLFGPTVGAALAGGRSSALRRIGMLIDGAARGESPQRAWRRILPARAIHRLLRSADEVPDNAHPTDVLQYEQDTYLRDTLLRDTDVMGMAHGVEIRAPYLDPEVLASAAAVGAEGILARGKPPKWLLREGWGQSLEPGTLARPKTGFTLDVARWMRNSGHRVLEEALQTLRATRAVDQDALADTWHVSEARLATGHPAAWVSMFALIQLAKQFQRWESRLSGRRARCESSS
jgi:asparagine synthase (glutamine-hydrolysing)